jgi:hypothetical protein
MVPWRDRQFNQPSDFALLKAAFHALDFGIAKERI